MITVVKRDGTRVPLDISKIQRQVAFGCQGIDGVSPSMIEIKAQIELHDGMATKTIDELLLKAMVNLIDETENPELNNTNYHICFFKIISPTITSCRYIFIYKSWFIVWFFLLKRCSFFLILFAIISIFLILFRILSSRRSRISWSELSFFRTCLS